MHEDTEVSVSEVEQSAPWGLDRLDQTALPLNLEFDYYNLGTGVNVYIVDTVRETQYIFSKAQCVPLDFIHAAIVRWTDCSLSQAAGITSQT